MKPYLQVIVFAIFGALGTSAVRITTQSTQDKPILIDVDKNPSERIVLNCMVDYETADPLAVDQYNVLWLKDQSDYDVEVADQLPSNWVEVSNNAVVEDPFALQTKPNSRNEPRIKIEQSYDSSGSIKKEFNLALEPVTNVDSGVYKCVVQDQTCVRSDNCRYVNHQIHVIGPIVKLSLEGRPMPRDDDNTRDDRWQTGTTLEGKVLQYEGRENYLGCSAVGGWPQPTLDIVEVGGKRLTGFITPQFYNETLSGDIKGLQVPRGYASLYTNQNRVTREDDGKLLRCTATVHSAQDQEPQSMAAEAELEVWSAPNWSCTGKHKLPMGQSVSFTCMLQAKPMPTSITWRPWHKNEDRRNYQGDNLDNDPELRDLDYLPQSHRWYNKELGFRDQSSPVQDPDWGIDLYVEEATDEPNTYAVTIGFNNVQRDHYTYYELRAENPVDVEYLKIAIKQGELEAKEWSGASSMTTSLVMLTVSLLMAVKLL